MGGRVVSRRLGARGLTLARRLASLGQLFPAVVHAERGNKSFTADLYPLGLAGVVQHLRTTREFLAAADAGTLPGFGIVDPAAAESPLEALDLGAPPAFLTPPGLPAPGRSWNFG
jgi:hypothetical protein